VPRVGDSQGQTWHGHGLWQGVKGVTWVGQGMARRGVTASKEHHRLSFVVCLDKAHGQAGGWPGGAGKGRGLSSGYLTGRGRGQEEGRGGAW
jgi:hypothetical protein